MSRKQRWHGAEEADFSHHEDEDAGYDGPSRSAQKRDAHAQTALVEELLKLGKDQLKKFTFLDDDFKDALALYKRMGYGPAYRRQRNYLGKRIRSEGWDEQIRHMIKEVTGDTKLAVAIMHRCEAWRDRLLAEGDEALTGFLDQFPDADRQALRQLVRSAKQEQEQQKPPKSARQLFRIIRELHQPLLEANRPRASDETDEDELDD